MSVEDEAGVASIAALLQQAATARAAARAASMLPAHSLPFLQVSHSQAHLSDLVRTVLPPAAQLLRARHQPRGLHKPEQHLVAVAHALRKMLRSQGPQFTRPRINIDCSSLIVPV